MKQRLVVVSFFRDCEFSHNIPVFMRQVAALKNQLSMIVHVNAVYGDCVDNTAASLLRHAETHNVPLQLVECNHGGPVFGSTEAPERLAALSKIGNAGLASVSDEDDFVLYVESDLLWDSSTLARLLKALSSFTQPAVVAPLIFAGTLFYDVFCYRKSGTRFSPFYPFHSELDLDGITPVDSVGSCLVMHAEVARKCRMTDGVLIEFCGDVWRKGYSVNVDARERIHHPA